MTFIIIFTGTSDDKEFSDGHILGRFDDDNSNAGRQ